MFRLFLTKRLFTASFITALLLLTLFYRGDYVSTKNNEATAVVAPITVVKNTPTLSTDLNGNGVVNPGDTLTYTVTVSNGATDATGVIFTDVLDSNLTLVGGSVNSSPIATNDSFNVLGNVSINVPAGSGVKINDLDPDGTTPVISGFGNSLANANSNAPGSAATSANGGNVTLNADGSFTYNPPAGFEGADSFFYTLSDGTASDTAPVTLNISGMIWFIKNDAAACTTLAAGCGRLSNPFSTLASFASINNGTGNNPAANDNIFIYTGSGSYDASLTLLNNQKLIGQGASATLQSISGVSVPSFSAAFPSTGGTNPTLISTTANAVNLASGNTLRGLTIGNTTGSKLNASASVGTLTIGPTAGTSDVTLNGTGRAINLTGGGTLAARFALVSANGGTNGIVLTGMGGNLESPTTTVQNSTGTGISISNSVTGGTFNFGNTTSSGTAGTGVLLSGNANNLTFAALNITPNAGQRAFHATNNTGTITTTSGTISTTNNIAVEVVGTSTASRTPLNMQLTSVSASGGANGIILTNTSATGSPGGFRVLGNGGTCTLAIPTCTGGRITNTTGADDATPLDAAGIGVRLNNADTVVLTRMRIDTHTNFAIYGNNVNGFTLDTSVMDGINGNNAGFDENTIAFDNLLGSAAITNSHISGGHEDNLDVENTSGTLNRLTITGTTFGTTSTNFGEDGLVFVANNSAVMNLTVTGCTFQHGRSDLLQTVARDTSTMEVVILNSTFDNDHPNTLSGGGGIVVEADAAGDAPTLTFNISGNSFRDALGTAINIYKGPGTGSVSGTINNNIIGVSGVANSGSSQGFGISVDGDGNGTVTVAITNNFIRQYNDDGININAGNSETGGNPGDVTVNATVSGNLVEQPGTFGGNGFELNGGTNTGNTNQICLDVINNTLENGGSVPNFEDDVNLRQRFGSVIRMPGYTGGAMDTTAVQNYIAARNPGAETVVASASGLAGTGYFNTVPPGSNCPSASAPTGSLLAKAEIENNALSFSNIPYQMPAEMLATLETFAKHPGNSQPVPSEIIPVKSEEILTTENPVLTETKAIETDFWKTSVAFFAEVVGRISNAISPTVYSQQPDERVSNNKQKNQLAGETVCVDGDTNPACSGAGFTLPANESTTITFRATVNSNSTATTIPNTANVTAAGGINQNSNTVNTTVVQPPLVAKDFVATFISVGGTTNLNFTITNPNSTQLTGVSLTDVLPSGLSVANSTTSVCGGTNNLVVTAATRTIQLTGATVPANNGTCTFSVTVTGAAEGAQVNVTGNVNSTQGGQGNTATDTVTVINPPTLAKTFTPNQIQLNSTSVLQFTLSNPNTTLALNTLAFSDSLPMGVTAPNTGATTVCTDGSYSISGNVISFSKPSLAAGANCVFSVTVTGTSAGSKTNTTSVVTVANSNSGAAAMANLTVIAPATVSKAFGSATIPSGGSTNVTVTLSNSNPSSLTGAAFTDNLVNMSAVGGPVTGTCAGTMPTTLSAGATSLSFSGITIPANGSCTVVFAVTSTTPGDNPNTTSGVSSNEAPIGGPSNTAILTVVAPPVIAKAFTPTGTSPGGSSVLSFTINAPAANTVPLTGISFTDTFPTGIQVAAIPNVQPTNNQCGAGSSVSTTSNSVVLAGGNLSPGATCSFTVDVTATTGGTNTVTVNSANGGTGNTASATLTTCVPPPANMLAWYTGDATTRDIAGGNDASISGTVTYTTSANGKVDEAFSFAGSGFVTRAAGSPSPLNITGDAVTIDGWIRPTLLASDAVFFGKTASGGTDYALLYQSNQISAIVTAGGTETAVNTGFVPPLNQWTHVAMTYDGANIRVYVNGGPPVGPAVTTAPKTGNIAGSNVPFNIGGRSDGLSFNGQMDEVEVFDRALDQAEIQAIVAADAGGKCKPADLRIAKTASGTFTQGGSAGYVITVTNDGPEPTSGTVTVTDTLPTGVTPGTVVAATGWTCMTSGQNVTCTRMDGLASGASYPTITIPVAVAQNAPASVVNTATAALAPSTGELDTSDNNVTITTAIGGVALTPTVSAATTLEDTQTTSGLLVTRNANDGAEVTHFKVTSITNGTVYLADGITIVPEDSFVAFGISGSTQLRFTPAANLNTTGSIFDFDVQASTSASNAGLGGMVVAATITVTSVNDAPTLNDPADVTINEDAGAQTVNLSGITVGPANEAGQTLAVMASSDNPGLIPNPTVTYSSPSATGSLSFTPVAGQSGSAVITVTVTDNGGTANGGVNTFSQTFAVTVTAINDAPTLDDPADVTILEDAGQQTVGLSGITAGANETQVLSVSSTSNNTGLVPNPTVTYTSPSTTGSLTFTPVANASGTAIVTVTVTDDGGTANGGVNTFSQTFTVNVTAVNDAPTLDDPADLTINEDVGQTVNLTGISAGPNETQTLGVTATSNNPGLIPNPTVAYTSPNSTGSLSFTPTANQSGSAVITVTVTDNGGTANGGVNTFTQTFTVTVQAINDAPTLNDPADVTILEDAGIQTVSLTGISAGPANENTQTLAVAASSNNTALIPNPTVAYTSPNTTGSLTFTPVANQSGTVIITVTVMDDGGTANGGINTFSQSFAVNVTPVNDPPTLNDPADVTINEDANTQTVNLSNITSGPSESQTLTVTASSNSTGLIPNPTVSYTSPNTTGSLTFAPVANQNGTAIITVTVTDNGGTANGGVNTFSQTFTVTVTAVNDPPTFTLGANQTVNEDAGMQTVASFAASISPGPPDEGTQTVTFNVTNNNNSLFAAQPAISPTGTLTYAPAMNAFGTATVSVTATDSGGAVSSPAQTFVITVNPVNDAPVANNDLYSINEDTPLTVAAAGVLTNDTDVDNTNAQLTVATPRPVSGPANGTLTLNANGSFTYTPNANYFGTDSFTYRASDGTASSNTATVSITVNAVNDAPVANDDAFSTNEDTPLTVAAVGVLTNDTDVDNTSAQLSVATPRPVTGPTNGTLTLNGNGSFTYTPNANYFGTDSFTYRASDGTVTSNLATVVITVSAVNDAPIAINDAYSTDEDTPLTVAAAGVLTNDTDVDNTNAQLTVAVPRPVSGPANGTLTLNGTGSFTYTPNANYNGSDSFTYRASDGTLNSNLATVTIAVNAVNDAPVANDDAYTGVEDTALTVAARGVLTNDNDIDNTNVQLSVATPRPVTGPTNGTLVLNTDGSFTYTPNANFFGNDSFTYRTTDGLAMSNTATVNISVASVNDAPVANNDAYSTNEDTQLVIAANGVLANDTDIDHLNLQLTVAAPRPVSGTSNGTLTLNANGSFTYTPNPNFNGADSFTYRATDGSANSNLATVAITVNAINDAPVAIDDAYSTNEDTQLVVAASGVLTNDADVDNTIAQLTVAVPRPISGPTNGGLTLNADGSFTYTPNENFNGTDSFTYRASDGTATSNLATVVIIVNAVNDAPVANSDTYAGIEDTVLTVPARGVLTNDTDIDNTNTQLSVATPRPATGPANGTLVLNADGSFTYTPNPDFAGTDSFTYRASDGTTTSNLATVSLLISDVPDRVTISGNIQLSTGPGSSVPLSGATVGLSGSQTQTTTTDATGTYSFTVAVGGTYGITPAGLGKTYEPIGRTYANVSTNVTNADFTAFDPGALQRSVRIQDTFAAPGSSAAVPVILNAIGNERQIAFSLVFDTARVNVPTFSCGADAPGCVIYSTPGSPGEVGVNVSLPMPLAAGDRHLLTVNFQTNATVASNIPLLFGDSPVARGTFDVSSNPLSTTYTGGFVIFTGQGNEGDLAPRITGDGLYRANDVETERSFVAGLTSSGAANEYERADVAPYASRGNGRLDAADFQLVLNYVAGLVAPQTAGGPATPLQASSSSESTATELEGPLRAAVDRDIRGLPVSGGPNTFVSYAVELVSTGEETVTTFSLQFDPSKLSINGTSGTNNNPDVTAGTGANPGTSRTVNATQTADGRIGVLLDFQGPLQAGVRQIVVFRFRILPTAQTGFTPVTFVGTPIALSTTNGNADPLTANYTPSGVTVVPFTAAGVTVGGRVMTLDGRGLRNARVTLTDAAGNRRLSTSSTFGYYRFEEVEAGGTYVIAVSSKRYRFAPRAIQVIDSITDLDFLGLE